MGNKGSTKKGGKGEGGTGGGSAPTVKKAKKLKKWGPYQQQPAETEGGAWLCTVESDVLPASFPDERSVKKFLRDYVHVSGKEGEVVVFKPGSLFGLDVTIKECVNCDIYVCDNTAAVTVVDCRDCRMVIGPCDTSVFVRSSTGCKFAIACQQFRSADMKNTDLLLFTQTEPVIERVSKLTSAASASRTTTSRRSSHGRASTCGTTAGARCSTSRRTAAGGSTGSSCRPPPPRWICWAGPSKRTPPWPHCWGSAPTSATGR